MSHPGVIRLNFSVLKVFVKIQKRLAQGFFKFPKLAPSCGKNVKFCTFSPIDGAIFSISKIHMAKSF